MGQALLGLISGLAGIVIGCIVTWRLKTQAARNQARRETLVTAAKGLQDYMVDYALFYVEYLSPDGQAKHGHWAQLSGDTNSTYLQLLRAVDIGRGHLKIINGLLFANFPQEIIRQLSKDIMTIVVMTAMQAQADCREVDRIANRACDLIPDLIKKYA
jgi:hypothetical protein